MQVAVARLVGYRWPAEQDETIELADKARALIAQAAELDDFADEDGIVCLPPVAGERTAADRLTALLRAAYGPRWTSATLRDRLEDAGVNKGGLDEIIVGARATG